MDNKELAENILTDLMNNGSISDILLKTKIFASKRGDKALLDWVTKELNGYDDEKPPKYRLLGSGLRVDVHVPFVGGSHVDFPIDMIENDDVRNRLSVFAFHSPIAEIESLCNDTKDEGKLYMKVPVYAYQFLSGFINGDIQDAYQYTTKSAVKQILVSVKSVLIDFLLKISSEEDIDFNTFIKTNPSMEKNITINAGIVNAGNGTVNAQGATTVVGDNNIITADNKAELLRILAEMLTEEIHDDVLSELYGGDYSRSGDDTGIVLTPPHICELCCELLKLKAGDVLLEPCCGTGRFLVTAMKYVGDKVYGVEVQDDLHAISSANVILHGGVESKVAHGDFFTEDFSGVKFTAGYMNPPYSQKTTELQFTERLLSVLCVGARAAVIVPVSVMIGKTRADKQVKAEILKHHRLEGVITLNKDTFYGVGTVPCIAIFTAGKPHPPEYEAKFVNFENDGYEVKKHIGLVETDAAKSLKEYLLDSWRGKRTDYRTSFMVKSMVEASDEWLHSFYYYNDDPPTDEKFESSITDYLTFEANMIFHGRGYLFEGGETNADRTDQDTERRGRGATESGQAVEEAPQQYRIVYDV